MIQIDLAARSSEEERVSIALQNMKRSPNEFCKRFSEYQILDQSACVKIAKIATQICAGEISKHIGNFRILSRFERFTIARMALLKKPEETSEYIHCYSLSEGQSIRLAKLGLQVHNFAVSKWFAKYNIRNPYARLEIAIQAAGQRYSGISQYIKNYQFHNPFFRFEVAKRAAHVNGRDVLQHIQCYDIQDPKLLLEIVRTAAEGQASSIAEYLDGCLLRSEESWLEIANILAVKNPQNLLEHWSKFKITDRKARARVLVTALLELEGDLHLSVFQRAKGLLPEFHAYFAGCSPENAKDLLSDLLKAIAERHIANKLNEKHKLDLFIWILYQELWIRLAKELGISDLDSYFPVYEQIAQLHSLELKVKLSAFIAKQILFAPNEQRELAKAKKLFQFGKTKKDSVLILPQVLLMNFAMFIEDLQFLKPLRKSLIDVAKLQRFLSCAYAIAASHYIAPRLRFDLYTSLLKEPSISVVLSDFEILKSLLQDDLYQVGLYANLLQDLHKQCERMTFHEAILKIFHDLLSHSLQMQISMDAYQKIQGRSSALPIYAYNCSYEQKEKIKQFVADVISGNFTQSRYAEMNFLGKELKQSWQTGLTFALPGGHTIEETDYWEDLLLCGTEVRGSCFHIYHFDPCLQYLLAYLIDGKNRIAVVKNKEGKIVARRLLRLFENRETKEILIYQEKLYCNPGVAEEALKELNGICLKKADFMNVALVTTAEPGEKGDYPNDIVSLPVITEGEYIDALRESKTQKFWIGKEKIKTLYLPKRLK